MRIGLDSNVVLYAEGMNDAERHLAARALIGALRRHELVLPIQVCGEVFNVLRRKFGRRPDEANALLSDWLALVAAQPETRAETFSTARGLAAVHDLQIWDAVILAASAEAGCRLLLSEDMQDGFVWRGVTVANPFAATLHPLLADALRA